MRRNQNLVRVTANSVVKYLKDSINWPLQSNNNNNKKTIISFNSTMI